MQYSHVRYNVLRLPPPHGVPFVCLFCSRSTRFTTTTRFDVFQVPECSACSCSSRAPPETATTYAYRPYGVVGSVWALSFTVHVTPSTRTYYAQGQNWNHGAVRNSQDTPDAPQRPRRAVPCTAPLPTVRLRPGNVSVQPYHTHTVKLTCRFSSFAHSHSTHRSL